MFKLWDLWHRLFSSREPALDPHVEARLLLDEAKAKLDEGNASLDRPRRLYRETFGKEA